MKQTLLLAGFILSLAGTALAQKTTIFCTSDGAIRGYDAVAYFKDGKPVKGSTDLAYTWKDAKWLFATKEHLDLFKANPEKYAPQYGGYCAYGTSVGHLSTTDPQVWTIVDEKLYLNYNSDVKVIWNKDQAGNIKKADKNWPDLTNKKN